MKKSAATFQSKDIGGINYSMQCYPDFFSVINFGEAPDVVLHQNDSSNVAIIALLVLLGIGMIVVAVYLLMGQ